MKFTLLLLLFFSCFVFLYLIPGRRQLPKLWKFPGIVLRCCLHPLQPSKKYVCKQTFDCCRECNTSSTRALAWPGTLMVRVCTERTNACATVFISSKNRTRNYPTSFQHYPLLINPPPLHPPRNPEYWYSSLQPGSMWMRPLELYFLHVQYNFKQLPLCKSCFPDRNC